MIPTLTLDQQNRILEFAEKEGAELKDALDYFDTSYDSLIYERSHKKKWKGHRPPVLSDYAKIDNHIPMVSFFSGCGGLDLGFEASGFFHVAAFEINDVFCSTIRYNRPQWKVFGPPEAPGDVSSFSEISGTLERIIGRDFEGVFVGGPPCQPFSIAANQRFSKSGDQFKRVGFSSSKNGNLLFDYVALIAYFRPACFLIENVAGLRDIDGGAQLSEAVLSLENSGYKVNAPAILNAADFAVPQTRNRLFIIGTRRQRDMKLPSPGVLRYGSGSVLGRRRTHSSNSETRAHKLESVKRYVRLDYGQRDQLGRVDRLRPEHPSKTVIAGGNKGGGRSHLHPEIPRTLSVRECAQLQTFPDDYLFIGSIGRQFTQVGNAIPPVLAAQIGTALACSVYGVK